MERVRGSDNPTLQQTQRNVAEVEEENRCDGFQAPGVELHKATKPTC